MISSSLGFRDQDELAKGIYTLLYAFHLRYIHLKIAEPRKLFFLFEFTQGEKDERLAEISIQESDGPDARAFHATSIKIPAGMSERNLISFFSYRIGEHLLQYHYRMTDPAPAGFECQKMN
jgi:hypothetical protein